MAKKKKTKSKGSSVGRAAKDQKKKTGKAATVDKSAAKKAAKLKSPGGRGSSVDDILKKYEKVRADHQQQLTAVQKNIGDLVSKCNVLEQQIAKLRKQESSTQEAISKLDSHRDEDVAKLLSKLGVQLSGSQISSSSQYDDDGSDNSYNGDSEPIDADSTEDSDDSAEATAEQQQE
jgi:hypothetical protein